MKNPGSARPKEKVDDGIREVIMSNFSIEKSHSVDWYEFSSDSTMRQVEKLFNGWYTNDLKPLTGVIQIFNLFNVKEQNIKKAKQVALNSKSTFLYPKESDILQQVKNRPMFLAWGYEYLNVNESLAKAIFDYVKNSDYNYLKADMIDNHFYHPGYINIGYGREAVKSTILAFLKYYTD